jgi:hypothetical protein
MLREDLKDSDIPHRTHIRKRVDELLATYLKELEDELRVGTLLFLLSVI